MRYWWVVVVLLTGCASLPVELVSCPNCNVVVVSMTNVGAAHLTPYGYDRDTTPHLDHLARRSIVFERAYSPASWTLPAGASFFTSQYPLEHRLMNRVSDRYRFSRTRLEAPTLFAVFQDQGYRTASFNGGQDYLKRYHFGPGSVWESFTHPYEDVGIWYTYGTFDLTIPAAMDWLTNSSERPFFLHVQGYDAHCPFAYPRENALFDSSEIDFDLRRCYYTYNRTSPVLIDGKKYFSVSTAGRPRPLLVNEEQIEKMKAYYDGEIRLIDDQLGILLQRLEEGGLMESTIVIVMSEHGDMIGKQGRFMRGGPLRASFYEDVLHVPLILYHPRMQATRVTHPVSLIDVAPTLLSLLDIALPATFRGQSLFEPHSVFAGSLFTPSAGNVLHNQTSVSFAVWERGWKLIKELLIDDGKEELYELYDIERDPEEAFPLFRPLETARLNETLHHWLKHDFGLGDFSLEGLQRTYS